MPINCFQHHIRVRGQALQLLSSRVINKASRILAEFLQRCCGLLIVLVRISLGQRKLDCSQLGPCGLIQMLHSVELV